MGDWPVSKQFTPSLYSGFQASSTRPKTVTAPGSINTKGAWLQLTTSVAPVNLIMLDAQLVAGSGTNYQALMDLGIGGAGSQVVVVPNLLFSAMAAYATDVITGLLIPVQIPPATAIWARYQVSSLTGGGSVYCAVRLIGSSFMPSYPLNRVTPYGVSESVPTYGVAMTSGAANTEGAWTQVAAAINYPCENLLILFLTTDSNSAHNHSISIGIGTDPNEITIIEKLWTNRQYLKSSVPVQIPAGSTIWAKYQSTGATQTGYLAVYGVD